MALKELYHPEGGRMRIAALMSGSGTNLRSIIEHAKHIEESEGRAPYQVVGIFTNNRNSKAFEIGEEHNLPVIYRSLKSFANIRGFPLKDQKLRIDYDAENASLIRELEPDVLVGAGYMLWMSDILTKGFLCVNVHPADLTIEDEKGNRKYTGDNAVEKALRAGEKYLRATTHIMNSKPDQGPLLMVSTPMLVDYRNWDPNNEELVKAAVNRNQSALKEQGDWIIFPKTLEYMADGRYSQDERGKLYFDGVRIPDGCQLELR